MNDELMNLEDDAPSAVVAPPDAPPAAALVPVDGASPTEVDVVVVGGQKLVPLAALHAERTQRQDLKAKADHADALAAENAALRPYAEFLRANPQLMQPRAPEAPPALPTADPDAVEAAQLMDFYKADGTLDVDRGAKYLALQDRRAGRAAQTALQPLQERSLQERSTQNFALALTMKDKSGQTPSPEALASVWRTLPVSDTANSEIAATLAMLAMGADRMMGKGGASPPVVPLPPPALVTEASGGGPAGPVRMSRLEETISKNRDMTPAKWAEATKDFQLGRPTVMEE